MLIATWNNGAELQGCLGSLRQLEYPKDRLEVVIFDNGSTDGTEQAVRECSGKLEAEGWARVAFDRSSENLGAFGGRAAARRLLGPGADFVLSLDDDAEPEPDALVRLVRAPGGPRGLRLRLVVRVPDPTQGHGRAERVRRELLHLPW